MTFNINTSSSRIVQAIGQITMPQISRLTRTMDLGSLALNQGRVVDGVHVYLDILNANQMLRSDAVESERCHRRMLRFLHILHRVAHHVFHNTDAVKIDLQNQRLHYIVYKPYGEDERAKQKRIAVAVAVARRLVACIREANELHAELANAEVAVGIESGETLAICNGTRGDRELLFVGPAANEAAKLITKQQGIFLGPVARQILGGDYYTGHPQRVCLVEQQIDALDAKARLEISPTTLVQRWKAEQSTHRQDEFQFVRPMPPLSDLRLDDFGPGSTRRIDCCPIFADLSGFTKFVAASLKDLNSLALALQVFHVVRKELRDVLHSDFDGRKIRYVGDCVQGVLAVGDGRSTNAQASIRRACECAGAMRTAFDVIQNRLPAAQHLGLAIGLDYGSISITRLGVRGSLDRCMVGRAVIEAERVQQLANGTETRIGTQAYMAADHGVRSLFGTADRAATALTYNRAAMHFSADSLSAGSSVSVPTPSDKNIILPRPHAS